MPPRPVRSLAEELEQTRPFEDAAEEGLPTLTVRRRLIEEAPGITRLIDKLETAGLVPQGTAAEAETPQMLEGLARLRAALD